jgi:hypothetical protein
MDHAVDLDAPRRGRYVRGGRISERRPGPVDSGHHQVGLGIADQVLHDPLRLRVRALAKVRPKPIVHGEADVLRCRDHLVRDDPAFQAPHPIREHHARDTAEHLEALGQQSQRRVGALVIGEAHEPHPAPRQHRAEHMQPTQHAPIDHQMHAR